MIRVAWAIEGVSAGSAEVESLEGAAKAFTGGVRAALAGAGSDVVAQVLYGSVGRLRHSMLTDGQMALADCGRWSAAAGGILVSVVTIM